jgi:hypothetical protein
MDALQIDNDLKPDAKLYRYMKIETFMSFVEEKQIHLTNVNVWDDRWEVILSKYQQWTTTADPIPLSIPSISIYSQFWSLVRESDAMWRIYSPSRTGV